jgi:hypothetical protein
MTPLHMGALHAFELALTLLLAFGPFVLLGTVIVVRRRHERLDGTEPVEEPAAREHRVS